MWKTNHVLNQYLTFIAEILLAIRVHLLSAGYQGRRGNRFRRFWIDGGLYGRRLHFFPGHALHEKSFQRQKGVVPLVGSQEQRAVLVPRLNRLPTGCQPVILFPHPVPGHALHEKGLQRQMGLGTLVSSQELRALAVPLINRG